MSVREDIALPSQRICTRCNFVSSQEVCKACVLLEGLNKGLPKLGIGKSSKARKMLEDYNAKQNLQTAIEDINEQYKKNNCVSKGKVCRSSCKSHTTSNEVKVHTNKLETCCNGTCGKENIQNGCSSKVNVLLEEYGINETQNELSVSSLKQNDSPDLDNVDFDADLHNNEESVKDDDITCAGACGNIDSLHISF